MIPKEIILSYIRSDLSVLPVWGENAENVRDQKSPCIKSWLTYQSNIMREEDVDKVFGRSAAIGVIGGKVSGGLEILDFDNHDAKAKERFKEFTNICKDLITKYSIPYEKTPSGGYHFFYRAPNSEGNTKLAQIQIENRRDTIIETRGEGGYVVASPSKGYSLRYGDLTKIPLITEDERNSIIALCKGFDEIDRTETVVDSGFKFSHLGDKRPGDEYNLSERGITEAQALLKHAGWTNPYGIYWVRPGKSGRAGISASFGRVKKSDGTPLLHVFSTNAFPFEDGKNYTPFAIFSILACNNDYKDAAKELVNDGFGDQRGKDEKKPELPKEIQEKFKRAEAEAEVDVDTEEKHGKKKKKSAITEAKEYLACTWEFRMNVINNVIESRRLGTSEWANVNENDIWMDINEYGIKMSKDAVKSILGSSFVPQYNAFEEYFHKLPAWDGVDYFEEMTKYMTIDDPAFFRDMLEKQFVRAIKCALEDEYYNRIIFVLQSQYQEIGKSRFVHALNPFGNKYFSEQQASTQKDSQIALSETFIYNMEELGDIKKDKVPAIKSILAKYVVYERKPYASQAVAMPRRCTFFGSTNFAEFLTDDTNTRWLIFKVDAISEDLWKSVNKDDLWAQAWTLYNDPDYEYELTPEEKLKREERNKSFREVTIEESIIMEHFEPSETNWMMPSEIIRRLVMLAGVGVRVNISTAGLTSELDTMGFKYKEYDKMNVKVKLYGIIERVTRSDGESLQPSANK